MADTRTVELRTIEGGRIAIDSFEADYVRGLEGLWRTSTDEATRRAVLRGLKGSLEAARGFDPAHVLLVIDGIAID